MTIKVQTKYGTVIGRTDDLQVSTFLGIPFAKQPMDELRWKPPQKPDITNEEIEAFEYGKAAIQEIDEIEPASLHTQGEDCLTLNIWVRNLAESIETKKPVMVFIHGGSYMSGGTTDPLYEGYNFAADNEIVFVSINYRLNVFGFMNLEEFGGKEYRQSGHLGLLDQICALEWIKENIEKFGGDAENVTLFGESCGGGSVSLLMTMPGAKGLFNKVIAQSGFTNLRKSTDLAKQFGKDFADKFNCSTMEELKLLSVEDIRKVYASYPQDYEMKYSIMFAPDSDNEDLPRDSLAELQNGSAQGIKLMLGTNANEFNYWKLYFPDFEHLAMKFLSDQVFVQGSTLHHEMAVTEEFQKYRQNNNLEENGIALTNEVQFRIPAIRMAEAQSRYNDTYMYYFKWESTVPGLKSCHALEVPFIFKTQENEMSKKLTGENPPKMLAEKMQKAWVAFATKGCPDVEGLPKWEKYDTEKRATMIINESWILENDPESESRKIVSKMFDNNL